MLAHRYAALAPAITHFWGRGYEERDIQVCENPITVLIPFHRISTGVADKVVEHGKKERRLNCHLTSGC